MRRLPFVGLILLLIAFSLVVMRSIAPFIYPTYFVYVGAALLGFYLFSRISFDILSLFWRHVYVLSVLSLFVTFVIGQASRGVLRWIAIGPFTFQPSEFVRPFLFLFFAVFLGSKYPSVPRYVQAIILFAIPFLLIVLQPSLGVAIITAFGFLGCLLSSPFPKKYIFFSVLFIIVLAPVGWHFLQPYQRSRIMPFLSQTSDSGLSYNSIQSVISVGSGRLWGRGLGEGIQTQLAFLPERHTDFAFASISEELGFIGAFLVLFFLFILLWLISSLLGRVSTHSERIFVGGALASLFAQVFVHVGMNVGFLPVTGLPLPLVSVGGSSLVSTMILLGILLGIYERV